MTTHRREEKASISYRESGTPNTRSQQWWEKGKKGRTKGKKGRTKGKKGRTPLLAGFLTSNNNAKKRSQGAIQKKITVFEEMTNTSYLCHQIVVNIRIKRRQIK